jgi:hypothetical protein
VSASNKRKRPIYTPGNGGIALPLVICAVLKVAYDVALLLLFRNVRPPEETQA